MPTTLGWILLVAYIVVSFSLGAAGTHLLLGGFWIPMAAGVLSVVVGIIAALYFIGELNF